MCIERHHLFHHWISQHYLVKHWHKYDVVSYRYKASTNVLTIIGNPRWSSKQDNCKPIGKPCLFDNLNLWSYAKINAFINPILCTNRWNWLAGIHNWSYANHYLYRYLENVCFLHSIISQFLTMMNIISIFMECMYI